MQKGSTVEANGAFIRHAHEAGLSIRTTMFKGYPGETAEDMAATADFLEAHAPYLDRVRFNEFSLLQDTPIFDAMVAGGLNESTMTVVAIERSQRERSLSLKGRSRSRLQAREVPRPCCGPRHQPQAATFRGTAVRRIDVNR